uniref:Uncharacterized protein n=1 Tax=Oryza punctata TaxID=4537 RepID=A0A0E0M908_ORYPU
MDPIVSIDGVSATGPDDAAGKNASSASAVISQSFDVAVRIRTRWFHFHLLPSSYTNGTVAVSCAGGAWSPRVALEHIVLTSLSPPVVSATVRAPPTALAGDARDRLDGELRRGEERLDVSVAYESDPTSIPSGGFRTMCAVTLLGRGDSTASCTA